MAGKKKEERIGMEILNKHGTLLRLVEYRGKDDIDVLDVKNNVLIKHKYFKIFKNGGIVSPYDKVLYGIGYHGVGEFKPKINGTTSKIYDTWHSMLRRCYSPNQSRLNPTYKGCTVCKEWHNFQNFAKWYEENYYEIDNDYMCLDKDILMKGNKIYSPETCVFCPNKINVLFANTQNRNDNCVIGVFFDKETNKYRAKCNNKHLGTFNTKEEAFLVYKETKEKELKNIANQYKEIIDERLYLAILNYKIETTD